uniref:DUF1788 domain-containing protein n=1 Tax=Candidatus Caldatribacterium saccharofermentans TaxID=1454753 RepID=A0A7V4THB8_9BACT
MPWAEVMGDLEERLTETAEGTFVPMDGIPFFRVLYPPGEEREALRQFRLLAERLQQQGWQVSVISLSEAMKKAIASLFGCGVDEVRGRLQEEEQRRNRSELKSLLSQYLPLELAEAVINHFQFQNFSGKSAIFLVRTGVLYPFMRPSHLLVQLEGKIRSILVIAYPGVDVGAFLDAGPAEVYGGYYRGEIIHWR